MKDNNASPPEQLYDPYSDLLNIQQGHRPPSPYELLGLEEGVTDRESIENAAKRRIRELKKRQLDPRRHVMNAVQTLLNEVATARNTLIESLKDESEDEHTDYDIVDIEEQGECELPRISEVRTELEKKRIEEEFAGKTNFTLAGHNLKLIAVISSSIVALFLIWMIISLGRSSLDNEVESLKSSDWRLRKAACESLGKRGESGSYFVIKALQDNDMRVSMAACETLGKYGYVKAVPFLIELLKSDNRQIRGEAAHAVLTIADKHPSLKLPLEKSVLEGYIYVGRGDWRKAGELGISAILALTATLDDKVNGVRRSAGETLLNICKELSKNDYPQAMPLFKTLLMYGERDIQIATCNVLGETGSPDAVSILTDALYNKNTDVLKSICKALVKIGSPQAISALIVALKNENTGKIASKELINYCDNFDGSASPMVISAIIDILKNGDDELRYAAREALKRIKSTSSIPTLIELLKNENSEIRRTACEILGRIGSLIAIPALTEALEDNDQKVRDAAREALNKIKN